MGIFKLQTDYLPSGDQPEAIAELEAGIRAGKRFQVLLGVTGSGKTFTIANVISGLTGPCWCYPTTKPSLRSSTAN